MATGLREQGEDSGDRAGGDATVVGEQREKLVA
jgi:hypothetical protein